MLLYWRRLLHCKEIHPVHPKDQSWVFIGRTDAEAETPILWPPDAKSWLIGKVPDCGRDWEQEGKGLTEYETSGWHHRLNAHEFQKAPRVGDGRDAWCAVIHGVIKGGTRLSNWTELNWVMYGCKSWTIMKVELWRIAKCSVEEDSSESLGLQEVKPVNPKRNQPWILIGRTDAEAPILWPPDAKSQLIGKNPNAERDWRQEKGTTENETVRWHHQLYGHEFEQASEVGDRLGSLMCSSPWGRKK